MVDVRVGTYNCAAFMADSKFDDDIDNLLPRLDLVGFQEFGSRNDVKNLDSHARKYGFTVVRGIDISTPIAYRSDIFTLLETGDYWLSPEKFVGDEGAGPKTLKRKHLHWIKVRHKTSGRIIYFGNCHLAPSIYIPVRRRLHEQQVENIAKWAESVKNNVIFVGDFNIDYLDDVSSKNPKGPFLRFGKASIRSTYQALGVTKVGTHGHRHIDYVWFRLNDRVTAVSHAVLNGYSSDHKPFVATLDIKPTIRKALSGVFTR